MPIPSSMEIPMKMRPRPAGTIIEVYPSTVQGLSVEIQSATASAAATSLWSSVILPPSSAGVWRYSAPIPDSTKSYYFKARYPAQPGYSAGPFTAIVSKKPGILPPRRPWDGTLRISTPMNDQGSMPPTAVPATFYAYAAGGIASNMWLSWGWSAANVNRADQSLLAIPAAPSGPAAPTLSQVAGGALAGRTRFVRIAYVRSKRLYPVSAESSLLISVNNLLKVQAPTNPGGGLYDGWAVLVGSASNGEIFQSNTEAFGVDWTEPVGGYTTTLTPYSTNWKSITAVTLTESATVLEYGFYDLTLALMRIVGGGANDLPSITTSATAAGKQNGDRMVPLSLGAMSATIPAAGGSNSGSVGGGKFL